MQQTEYTVGPMESDNDLMEIVIGPPKCRNFHQTGGKFEARPHLPFAPVAADFLPWRWFPWKIRVRMPLLLNTAAGMTSSASFAVLITQIYFRPALAWCGLIFINLFFTIPMLYLAYITTFNFKLREGICWCKGKARQAKEEWKKTTDPSRAKEVFFEWKCGGGLVLKVLNDGSQECWNVNGDELAGELSNALGLGGVMGDNGFVGAGVSDGAVKYKNKAWLDC